MNVVLISRDPDLDKLCREVLNDLGGCDWSLNTYPAADALPESELYIWDIDSKIALPDRINQFPGKHLFLIYRNELSKANQKLEGEASILLKPVSRVMLAAFLSMAIAAHAGRLTSTNVLRADRDKILQCLIQTNLRIQEYDQDRTNFLTRAVHEFRAPLTAASGYCGLLLNEALGPLNDDQREVLRRMQHSTKRLSRLASAMFQLSVGRYIKKKPDLSKGDIKECLEQAIHEIAAFVDGKRISVSVDFGPEPGPLYFERGQIEQILINLLDNACKFTPRGGEIVIQGHAFFWERRMAQNPYAVSHDRRRHDSRQANSYRIDIRDSGPPIPQQHLESIFEEYTSYGGGQDRSGGGLGLAICRMIATTHEGCIWAENTASGPTFSFVLPLCHPETGIGAGAQNTMINV